MDILSENMYNKGKIYKIKEYKRAKMKKISKGISLIMMITMIIQGFAFVGSKENIKVHAASSSKVKVKAVYYKKKAPYKVKISQKKINYRDGYFKFYNVKSLKKKKIGKIRVGLKMLDGKKVRYSKTRNINVKKITKSGVYNLKFPHYGEYVATFKYYKGKKAVYSYKVKNIGIIAEKYNIVALGGTFGPMLYTMTLWKDGVRIQDGNPVPTIIALSRPSAYDWKKLPKHVYKNPYQKYNKDENFEAKVREMARYVKTLHKLNRYSKFHVVTTDPSLRIIFNLMYENKISDKMFDADLYTDGTSTYFYFNEMYEKGQDQEKKTQIMVDAWNKAKRKALKGKKVDFNKMPYYRENSTTWVLARYTYASVVANSNFRWFVSRVNDTFKCENKEFLEKAKQKATIVNTKDALNELSLTGEKNLAEFKALYHFNDKMFEKARKNNKKVMLLMGGRADKEVNFAEFTKFLKKYYGTQYEYYYKGHPGTPTKLFPEKQKQLDELKVIDVESSIAAELILFFNPDVYISGMSDSTLNGAYKKGHTFAFLGKRVSEINTINNGQVFKYFFTKITKDYEQKIKELCTEDGAFESSFLVEDRDSSDIMIYNSNNETIKQYQKNDNGEYMLKQ